LIELGAVMDPWCSTWLVTQYQVRGDFTYFAYALYYTKLGFVGPFVGSEYFGDRLSPLNMADLLSEVGSRDYSKVPDPYGQDEEVEQITCAMLHGLILYAKNHNANIIVLPTHVESFLTFCNSLEPDFVSRLKESFLTNSVVEYLFEEYFSSAEVNKNLTLAQSFMDDFRRGVIEITKRFDDSYYLSADQIRWIREYVADQTARVMKYLNPIQLKKLVNVDITDAADLAETAIDVAKLLPWPIPLGILVESAKKLLNHEKFKTEGANFGLSLVLLQQLMNSKATSKPTRCEICNMSLTEMESCSYERITSMSELCELHLIGFIHIRKRYGLTGPDLLKAVKKFSMRDLTFD
jgi:hypothetical protein